jgi:hypothetical protein
MKILKGVTRLKKKGEETNHKDKEGGKDWESQVTDV